ALRITDRKRPDVDTENLYDVDISCRDVTRKRNDQARHGLERTTPYSPIPARRLRKRRIVRTGGNDSFIFANGRDEIRKPSSNRRRISRKTKPDQEIVRVRC